ncbi:phosducin-like protein [Planococcus citri]|uniref:phosducin-like protein n=1 Tax=Planococcus citri TaxID=170843 RepID=UPI0031F88496
MTTLDDKLLGVKTHYYCDSGSESENDSSDEKEPNDKATLQDEAPPPVDTEWNGLSKNTGPKGVLEDWQQYQELARKQREVSEKERLELCKKLALVCRPESEDNDESEEFLLEYRKKRMQEMMSQFGTKNVSFGSVFDIKSPNDFLSMIDEEDKTTTIIVHVFDNNHSACKKINDMLIILADQYKDVKFCKVLSTAAGLSLSFKISGVPAFLVYKNKQIIGNFVRVTNELGDDFCEGDIENFLIEHGILGDGVVCPAIAQ